MHARLLLAIKEANERRMVRVTQEALALCEELNKLHDANAAIDKRLAELAGIEVPVVEVEQVIKSAAGTIRPLLH